METTRSLEQQPVLNNSDLLEIQGPYGPINVPEKILQNIWHRKNFLQHNLTTLCGKQVKILFPGRLNTVEGPDFKEARIQIDNEIISGDVEIHFSPSDWFLHNHQNDPNYNNVILHVTLFLPKPDELPVSTASGSQPETLHLLPLLQQSLEEYATEEALSSIKDIQAIHPLQAFLQNGEEDQLRILTENAHTRWNQKCAFAKYRLSKASFKETAHQMALEVLGYRAPMDAIAHEYPLTEMATTLPDIEELLENHSWTLSGIRPANHPKKRLQQYFSLIRHNPTWPSHWLKFAESLPQFSDTQDTRAFRRESDLSKRQSDIKETILKHTLSGTRFHTLLIDALFPLASAHLSKDLFNLWFHTHPGDHPDKVNQFLHQTHLLNTNSHPISNGLIQGTLHLFLQSQAL